MCRTQKEVLEKGELSWYERPVVDRLVPRLLRALEEERAVM